MYNFSYHSILVIWVYTLVASTRGAAVSLGWKDNVNPRVAISDMEKSGKYKPAVIAKLRRREAAHHNAYEAMPMFCAAVVSETSPCLLWQFSALFAVSAFSAVVSFLCQSPPSLPPRLTLILPSPFPTSSAPKDPPKAGSH